MSLTIMKGNLPSSGSITAEKLANGPVATVNALTEHR